MPRLKPNDIRNAHFKGSIFGGFNKNQVLEFLEQVAKEMENLLREKNELEAELAQVKLDLLDIEEIKRELERKSDEVELLKQENELLRKRLEDISKDYENLKREYMLLNQKFGEISKEQRGGEEYKQALEDLIEKYNRLIKENEELKRKTAGETPSEVLRIAKATADKLIQQAYAEIEKLIAEIEKVKMSLIDLKEGKK